MERNREARYFERRELAAKIRPRCCGNPRTGTTNLPVPPRSRSRSQRGSNLPFWQALQQDPELYALAVACSEDKYMQLLATPFPGEGCIVAEVTLEEEGLGDVQFKFSKELSASTGRRLVVEWVRVSKDGAGIARKGGSGRWARLAVAQVSLSTNGFPISSLLRPVGFYMLPAALLGQYSWADPGVHLESSIVFGADREMTDRYTANVREAILNELKGAYQKMETVEEISYGKDSNFYGSEFEFEPEPEPEYGAKRQRDEGEAERSSKRARRG